MLNIIAKVALLNLYPEPPYSEPCQGDLSQSVQANVPTLANGILQDMPTTIIYPNTFLSLSSFQLH